ncbi:MAG: TRAP transporter TatT component family protein [Treponema sp.]|nr:TRAP transporter TatT component family protein [Treponema sp.]
MRMFSKIFVLAALSLVLFSCKSMIANKLGDAAAGSNKNGAAIPKKAGSPDMMMAFMGEKDPQIIAEVLPMIVKMYEILALQNPSHQGLQIMAGQLNVMYGNLCVQTPAESLPVAELQKQVSEFNRAKYHYLKGRQYILDVFESRWPGFEKAFLSSDEAAIKEAVSKITKDDVNAAYWAGGASLIAWSLDPLDIDALSSIQGPVALLEKAASLDPDYNRGAIWDALCQFYTAAPVDFGGDYERGLECYEKALKASGGKAPGVYITYAQSVLKPSGDRDGFIECLNKALAINPDDDPSNRLMCVLNQQKAQYLLDHVDDYFVVW